ncbi:MAG: hypothetical protein ACYDIE_12865 [Candidatus Krumholzibacteriia bacterium]
MRTEPAPRSAPPGARRPLRVLVMAPGDPATGSLELIGPHPLTACAAATRGRVVFTVVTDRENAPRFAALPAGGEVRAVPLWRVIPRGRLPARPGAARLQTALACLAAVAPRGERETAAGWDCVHGWDAGGALAAAAAARALGRRWAWTPPLVETDEHARWVGAWATREADLLLARDPAQRTRLRETGLRSNGQLAVLPWLAPAVWDEPAAAGATEPDGGLRLALLLGRDTTDAQAAAVMRALALLHEAAPDAPRGSVVGVGCRLGAGAAAVRREARRLGLLARFAWRDLASDAPLPRAGRAFGRPAAVVVLGHETWPPPLLAWLWRRGTPVLRADGGEPRELAQRLARLAGARRQQRRACRAAWHDCAADASAAVGGDALARSYARLAASAGHGGRGQLRLPERG